MSETEIRLRAELDALKARERDAETKWRTKLDRTLDDQNTALGRIENQNTGTFTRLTAIETRLKDGDTRMATQDAEAKAHAAKDAAEISSVDARLKELEFWLRIFKWAGGLMTTIGLGGLATWLGIGGPKH